MNKEGRKRRSLAIAGRYIRYYMDGDLFAFNWIDSIGGTEFHENLNTAVSIGNWSVVLCCAVLCCAMLCYECAHTHPHQAVPEAIFRAVVCAHPG